MKNLAWRIFGLVMAPVFFTLAALHFSPSLRYEVQDGVARMASPTRALVVYLVGEPFTLHDASTQERLAVSLAYRFPTRYVRDFLYWVNFREGDSFAAEGQSSNAFGITYVFFERNTARRQELLSTAGITAVCIGAAKAWVARVQGVKDSPVYYLDGADYILSFATDGSDKWKAIEHPC